VSATPHTPSASLTTALGVFGGVTYEPVLSTGNNLIDLALEYGLKLVAAAGLAAVGYLTKYYLDKFFQGKNDSE
jgi:hypothetical protein